MSEPNSSHLVSGWELIIPVSDYLFKTLLAVLIVRFALSVFKAFSIKNGEHLENDEEQSEETKSLVKAFTSAFKGFTGHPNIRDYWLPAMIGYAELASYPVLIVLGQPSIVGGWLAIKTAGQWRVWEKSRTAFNRFLVGNLLNIGISFFWLTQFVRICK